MQKKSVSRWTREAQRLRAEMTSETRRLWSRLRRRQLDGFKFRREHPIGPYFVDFYCHSERLAIEIDGEIHNEPKHLVYDRRRNEYLTGTGLTLLHFDNQEIRLDLDLVLSRIKATLHS